MTISSSALARLSRRLLAGLALAPLLAGATQHATWQRIDNPAPVVGLDGKVHRARCSGYPGTDPTFSLWARQGSSRNLVVYFEGGGTCWDSASCSHPITGNPDPTVPQFFVPQIPPQTDPAAMGGLFRADDPSNPVRDWDMLYIPYCTGDTHVGSATRTYVDVKQPLQPQPVTFDIEHRGFDNFMVALEWARRNFKAPHKVLVAGASAGGYGAVANSPWVARAFPQAQMAVLADSSQGVATPAFDQGTPGRGSWNPQFAPWVYGSGAQPPATSMLLRRAAQAQPQARFAQFTTAFDAVQIGVYGYMKAAYGPGGACANPAIDWNTQMRTQLLGDAFAAPRNFRFYLARGSQHTLLADSNFNTEASGGREFSAWLGDLIDAPLPAWFSRFCPECLFPVPCPTTP